MKSILRFKRFIFDYSNVLENYMKGIRDQISQVYKIIYTIWVETISHDFPLKGEEALRI